MATFNVTIVNNTTPAVANTISGTTTYSQFKNSLGNFVYYISRIYVYSPTLQQIQGNFRYTKYDVNGRQNTQTVISAIDPYQTISSLYIGTEDKTLVLNGQDFVRFNLLPNTSLSIKIYTTQLEVANVDALTSSQKTSISGGSLLRDNFKALENAQGIQNFFEQYKDNDFVETIDAIEVKPISLASANLPSQTSPKSTPPIEEQSSIDSSKLFIILLVAIGTIRLLRK